MAPHFPEVADAAEDASENAKWSCNHLPNFGVFSPSGVLASPNCKHKSYSGMVAHTSCDLLVGVVVEEQEMDAIFPRSHLAVPTCTTTCTSHLSPVCVHTCTNASVPHLYAHTLYHHLRICNASAHASPPSSATGEHSFHTIHYLKKTKKPQSSDQHLEQGQSSSAQCICDWCWTSVS